MTKTDNIKNIRPGLVTVKDVFDDLVKDLPNTRKLIVMLELQDGTLRAWWSEQLASDLALQSIILAEAAKRMAMT